MDYLWPVSCADPGIFVRGGGGGGGPGPTARKQLGQRFFFSPQLILQFTKGGPMVLLQRKLYFPKDPEVVQQFPGGQLFPRGVQLLTSIETHITCDFPWGLQIPWPPSESAHVYLK